MAAQSPLRPKPNKTDPNHYIALCARKYAECTRRIASTEEESHRNELKTLLAYLRDSAILEAEAVREGRLKRLPEDLRRWVARKEDVTRLVTRPEAEALRSFYAVPGGGLLGTLSSSAMLLLADLREGWACAVGLDPLITLQCQGTADGMRLLADFLGPDHEPHDPPARSINRFVYDQAFGSIEK